MGANRVAKGADGSAWISLPKQDDVRAVMGDGGTYDFGFFPAMNALMLKHPRIGLAFGGLFQEIMFSEDGVLSRAECEMVAAVAASAQDCFY